MSFYSKLKRFVIGKPLPNDAYKTERLNNFQGLAVLSADAISSTAYGPEEMLKVLVLAGVAGLGVSIWLAVAIVALLTILVVSYRQTVAAYPEGGGAYIVATANLGRNPGLLAAASLMIDYILTVSVSIASGVENSFTLSQSGMVKHWFNERSAHWQVKLFLNGLGAVATFIIVLIVIIAKFTEGAWAVMIAIPLAIAAFRGVNRHYKHVDSCLAVNDQDLENFAPDSDLKYLPPTAVIVVGDLHQGTLEALKYAHSIAEEIAAVHVDIGHTDRDKLQSQWEKIELDVHLEIIDSPQRSLLTPIINFVAEFEEHHPDTYTTVIIPVAVTRHWWEELLHNQTAFFLKNALQSKSQAVITTVRYYL